MSKSDKLDEIPDELVEALPEELKSMPKEELVQIVKATFFSGPILPPAMMKELEEALPGSGQWVLNNADENRRHRHKMERHDSYRSSMGLGLFYLFPAIGAFLTYNDAPPVHYVFYAPLLSVISSAIRNAVRAVKKQ